MDYVNLFCKKENCNNIEKEILKSIESKYKKILFLSKLNLINIVNKKYLKILKKKDLIELLYNYKKFLLQKLENNKILLNFSDVELIELEKKNKLQKNLLLDEKYYYKSDIYKKYGKSYIDLYKKLIIEVQQNQNYKRTLNLNEKEKLAVLCCKESYNYDIKNKNRPQSIIDEKHNTIYEYLDDLSDVNKSIWINEHKNIFNKKVIIISYRGTGVKKNNKFTFFNVRDLLLDIKIISGSFYKEKEVYNLIKDFDKLYKKYGKTHKIILCGHSLGGRIAFEIHRKRANKINKCYLFNPGFGLDVRYLHDIMLSKTKKYKWENNLYTYHIGGKEKFYIDDDLISVLAGGYGKSYTFYKNFNKGLKGHSIDNFIT